MSFLLVAAMIAAASAAGAAFARRGPRAADRKEGSPDPAAAKVAAPKPPYAAPPKLDERAVFARLPVSLGDVVSFDREERWLAGAIVARDGNEVVGAVFLAPEGVRLEAVAAFPAPRREIFWLSPIEVDSGIEPPTSADFGGVVMQRRSRIPVTLTRMGQGAPHIGETGIWAEYEAAAGARALLLRSAAGVFAWSGAHCDEGEWDRMGRGEGP